MLEQMSQHAILHQGEKRGGGSEARFQRGSKIEDPLNANVERSQEDQSIVEGLT